MEERSEEVLDRIKAGEGKLKTAIAEGVKERSVYIPKVNIKELKGVFNKWLELPDDNVLNVLCASVVANWFGGDPFWIFFVGPSSGSKTELLRSLTNPERINDGSEEMFYSLSGLSPNSLITGKPNTEDLLPALNNRVVIIKDLTNILSLRPDDRVKVFSDLRDCYDGYHEKVYGSGAGKKGYKSKFGIIAGTTPAIDHYYQINNMLGERFLRWFIKTKRMDIVKRAMKDSGKEDKMRAELHSVLREFLLQTKHEYQDYYLGIEHIKVGEDILKELEELADLCALLRSTVVRDHTGVVSYQPEPEIGARLGKQLMKLIMALAVVDGRTEVAAQDLDIVKKVAYDTIPKRETKILAALVKKIKEDEKGSIYFTTREVGLEAKIPTQTAGYVLDGYSMLGVVDKKEDPDTKRDQDSWSINPELLNRLLYFLPTMEYAKPSKGYKGISILGFAHSTIASRQIQIIAAIPNKFYDPDNEDKLLDLKEGDIIPAGPNLAHLLISKGYGREIPTKAVKERDNESSG